MTECEKLSSLLKRGTVPVAQKAGAARAKAKRGAASCEEQSRIDYSSTTTGGSRWRLKLAASLINPLTRYGRSPFDGGKPYFAFTFLERLYGVDHPPNPDPWLSPSALSLAKIVPTYRAR